MIEKSKNILRAAAGLWVIAIFVVGVFYIEDRYFNLLEAKALFCNMAALVIIGVSVFGTLVFALEHSLKENWELFRKNTRPLDVAVFCFMLAAILSNLVTEHPQEALWGSYGWSVGTAWVIMMGLVYFFVSRSVTIDRRLLVLIGIAAGLQFILVILNGFYVDPFALHFNLAAKDYGRYVGTIGNTNWYVGYVTMLFPFLLAGTGQERKGWERLGCGILLLLASMTCITINSQGVYLGVGSIVAVSLYLSVSDYGKMLDALRNLAVMCSGAGLIWIGKQFFPLVELDGLTLYLIRPAVWGSALGICLLLYFGLRLLHEERYRKGAVWIKRLYLLVVVLLAAGLVFSQIQAFDDSWGTNRGKTWRVAVQAFAGMPWVQKLFGGGTNCFGFFYLAQTGSDWVRNAHNEYLEYLVTTGIFGVLSYVGIYVSVVADLCRNRVRSSRNPDRETGKAKAEAVMEPDNRNFYTACGLAVLGYAFQALVNNPQALNGAMLVTILAVYRRIGQKMVE